MTSIHSDSFTPAVTVMVEARHNEYPIPARIVDTGFAHRRIGVPKLINRNQKYRRHRAGGQPSSLTAAVTSILAPTERRCQARSTTGPSLWKRLHQWAIGAPNPPLEPWLHDFQRSIGCGECRHHWQSWVTENPPDRAALFAWAVAAHNPVNRLQNGLEWVSVCRACGVYPAKEITPLASRIASLIPKKA